ncbi:MAG: rRNA maturation RNase YbeY [Armatimonadota bacterium]
MPIEVRNVQKRPVDAEAMAAIAALALEAGGGDQNADLSIALVDDAHIRRLNAQFLGRDRPTDVMAFPAGDEESLGEVVVSVQRAEQQARELERSLSEELTELVAHGVLHLLGLGDQDEPSRRRMAELQARVLARARRDGLI